MISGIGKVIGATSGKALPRLWSTVLVIALAGCSNSRDAHVVPASNSDIAGRQDRVQSWMSSAAKREDLLYVSDESSQVYVYSYPNGELVGTLTGLAMPAGECVDAKGDVWVTEWSANEVVEYAHGGKQSIATLTGPGHPYGCAVDASSGDLAVAGSELAVFAHAVGYPTTYSDSDFPDYFECAYDSAGNLFADNYGDTAGIIAELASGASQLETITLSEDLATASMQWDGSYVAIEGSVYDPHERRGPRSAHIVPRPLQINRVSVSGSSGTVVGETLLKTPTEKDNFSPAQFWISGRVIIGVDGYRHPRHPSILSWRYPKGGMPIRAIQPTSGLNTVLSRATRK